MLTGSTALAVERDATKAENERLRALLKNAEVQLHAYVAPHGAPVSAVTRLIVDEIRATLGTK